MAQNLLIDRTFTNGGSKARRDVELLRLRSEGWTYAALACRFGLSKSGVACAIKRHQWQQERRNSLGLSVRAKNAVEYGRDATEVWKGPVSLAELAALSYRDALERPCLGKVSAREIATVLWRHGIEMCGMPRALRDEIASSVASASEREGDRR